MLTVAEALDAILKEAQPAPPIIVELADALGLVTAEAVVSDVDSPPFDKALMDGFAVRSADVAAPEARLRIIEHVIAGMIPSRPVTAGTATRIMTGAPLPEGVDCVIKVEDTRIEPSAATHSSGATNPSVVGRTVVIRGTATAGANIIRRGTSLKKGQTVVPEGRLVGPQAVGALAEVGKERLPVYPRPTVGILATGDELVPVAIKPGPGQIRNSNEAMLGAQTQRAGGGQCSWESPGTTQPSFANGSSSASKTTFLLLSGGVSEGTHDLVPSVLAALGVRNVFHKVLMRPGKPLWFGVWERPDSQPGSRRTSVFGLPGNPVSSLVCFEVFVRSCLQRLMGHEPAGPRPVRARLTQDHVARGERPTYNPARLRWDAEGPQVTPVRWHGSSDLQAMVEANAVAVFPGGDASYERGTLIEVIPFDRSTDGSV